MPKKSPIDKHVKRWHRNRAFATRCDETDCDWLVTSLFYAILHGTQALLLQRGMDPRKHSDRNGAITTLVRRNDLSRDFKRRYSLLREASNHARYAPENTRYTTFEGVQDEIIELLFRPLEKELRKKLSPGLVGTLDAIQLVEVKKT